MQVGDCRLKMMLSNLQRPTYNLILRWCYNLNGCLHPVVPEHHYPVKNVHYHWF